jgi:hypothetical protein
LRGETRELAEEPTEAGGAGRVSEEKREGPSGEGPFGVLGKNRLLFMMIMFFSLEVFAWLRKGAWYG